MTSHEMIDFSPKIFLIVIIPFIITDRVTPFFIIIDTTFMT